DEDNEVIFEFPTNVSIPITNPNLIKILADKADFEALVTNVDLEGGIAIDDQGNIYIANDDNSNDVDSVIFKLTPAGDLSILCTQAELQAATGTVSIDLDVGMAISNKIYVGDDGDCDCIIEVDPDTCSPEILITDAEISALTGNDADLEGGVCIGNDMNLFLGDDGGDPDEPNIIKVPVNSPVLASLFVSNIEIEDFYQFLEPGADPRLLGSCDVQRDLTATVPTLSEWGLISMAAILGIVGFMVARRRIVKA
ncbi:MAG: IPTL-CTERM sorting domain-containing protein, partial [Thermodesulfobacteriota bacterium]